MNFFKLYFRMRKNQTTLYLYKHIDRFKFIVKLLKIVNSKNVFICNIIKLE